MWWPWQFQRETNNCHMLRSGPWRSSPAQHSLGGKGGLWMWWQNGRYCSNHNRHWGYSALCNRHCSSSNPGKYEAEPMLKTVAPTYMRKNTGCNKGRNSYKKGKEEEDKKGFSKCHHENRRKKSKIHKQGINHLIPIPERAMWNYFSFIQTSTLSPDCSNARIMGAAVVVCN